jgi:hypothetical protein
VEGHGRQGGLGQSAAGEEPGAQRQLGGGERRRRRRQQRLGQDAVGRDDRDEAREVEQLRQAGDEEEGREGQPQEARDERQPAPVRGPAQRAAAAGLPAGWWLTRQSYLMNSTL